MISRINPNSFKPSFGIVTYKAAKQAITYIPPSNDYEENLINLKRTIDEQNNFPDVVIDHSYSTSALTFLGSNYVVTPIINGKPANNKCIYTESFENACKEAENIQREITKNRLNNQYNDNIDLLKFLIGFSCRDNSIESVANFNKKIRKS